MVESRIGRVRLILFYTLKISAFLFLRSPAVISVSQRRSMTASQDEVDVNSLVNNALNIHRAGDFNNALRLYEDVLRLTIDNTALSSTINSNMGAIHMQNGDYNMARDRFMRSVDLSPRNAQARFNLAVVLTSKLSLHKDAMKHCAMAMQIDPDMHKAYHLMGNIMQNLNRSEDAEKYFERAEYIAAQINSASNLPPAQPSNGSVPPIPSSIYPSWIDLPFARVTKVNETVHILENGDDRSYSMSCMSDKPRIFHLENIISTEDCKALIARALAEDRFESSFIMGRGDSGDPIDPYRSSDTAWLSSASDQVISGLKQRIASLTGLPLPYIMNHCEDLQVVRYGLDGRFKAHQDSSAFHPRLLTVLVYLTDAPVAGGGTWFPFSDIGTLSPTSVDEAILAALQEDDRTRRDASHSRAGLVVTPKAGDAVLFLNHRNDGSIDPSAVHAGLPLRGDSQSVKWIANLWLEYNPERLADQMRRPT